MLNIELIRKRRFAALCMAGAVLSLMGACGSRDQNLVEMREENIRPVFLFSPMEKADPDAVNVARSAADLTIGMAEEKLGVTVNYITYTAENYQDKTTRE